jgi:chemotaxis signal transduction protein
MNKQTSRGKTRQAETPDTRVIVVEEGGELTAIVVDKVRGVVHIPLGSADVLPPFYS